MGGLFSTQAEDEERRRREEAAFRRTIEFARLQAQIQREREQQRQRIELQRLQNERVLAFHSYMKFEPDENSAFISRLKKHKVTRNLNLLNDLRRAFALTPLSSYPDKPYTEMELMETSWDYIRASSTFRHGNRPFFTISKITRVDNTFHVLQYHLMQDKYRNYYFEYSLSEHLMFHGTKREYLDSICTNNFDRSKVRTHKFGHGISFATNSFYATHYHHDNKRNPHKVMVLAQVFFGRTEPSTADMIVPSGSCYTSANDKASVIVKYDDASFYPLYIVYYDGLHPTNMKNARYINSYLE